jgi:hypothetical protein
MLVGDRGGTCVNLTADLAESVSRRLEVMKVSLGGRLTAEGIQCGRSEGFRGKHPDEDVGG